MVTTMSNSISEPCIDFQYGREDSSNGEELLKWSLDNTLRLQGDFGQMIFEGSRVFTAYEVTFKAPAEHTVCLLVLLKR